MKRGIFVLSLVFGLLFVNSVFAITDPYVKEQQLGIDLYLESSSLIYTPPTRLQPTSLGSASEDPYYWINQVLPYEQDRYHDVYQVIPQLGIVVPIITVPEGSSDYGTMLNGGQIDINKYLVGGALEYAGGQEIGYWGKFRHFAHSNNYVTAAGRYNNIYANLMAMDPGDQIWYFVKQSNGTFDLLKYNVTKSYPVHPSQVQSLVWDGDGADGTVFGCYHGLDGRWIVEVNYMGEPLGAPVPYVDPYKNMDSVLRSRIDRAISRVSLMPRKFRKYEIIQFFKVLDALKLSTSNSDKILIIDYVQQQLAEIYPE